MSDTEPVLARIAAALEAMAPHARGSADWLTAPAYIWDGSVRPIAAITAPSLGLLKGIDPQKELVSANVARLAAGHAAHDMLLWGARGMGKSVLLRAAVVAAQVDNPDGIALVQVTPAALASLSALFSTLGKIQRRFLVFIDDLGFEQDPSSSFGQINPRDAVDDQLALADRFGLSLGFHVCSQDDYLAIVAGYAEEYALAWQAADALEWAKRRGARSGRVAWQFITELAGAAGRPI
jgi:predicted AAA+ superfamily ATPase